MGSVVTAEDLMRKFRIIEESCNFALMSDAWPFRLLRLKFSLQILLCICYDITLEWLEYNSECSAPNPIRQEFNLSKGDFADWQVNFRFVAQLQASGLQIPQRQQSQIPNLFDKKIQKGKHYHDSRAPKSTNSDCQLSMIYFMRITKS